MTPPFSVTNVFSPATSQGPWSGFAQNVGVESDLRNQNYGLQKCTQAAYVPDSGSDLFSLQGFSSMCGEKRVERRQSNQTHVRLFETHEHEKFNPNVLGGSMDTFNNHTRSALNDADART